MLGCCWSHFFSKTKVLSDVPPPFLIVAVAHCPLFVSGYRSIQVPLFCTGMSGDMFICAMYYYYKSSNCTTTKVAGSWSIWWYRYLMHLSKLQLSGTTLQIHLCLRYIVTCKIQTMEAKVSCVINSHHHNPKQLFSFLDSLVLDSLWDRLNSPVKIHEKIKHRIMPLAVHGWSKTYNRGGPSIQSFWVLYELQWFPTKACTFVRGMKLPHIHVFVAVYSLTNELIVLANLCTHLLRRCLIRAIQVQVINSSMRSLLLLARTCNSWLAVCSMQVWATFLHSVKCRSVGEFFGWNAQKNLVKIREIANLVDTLYSIEVGQVCCTFNFRSFALPRAKLGHNFNECIVVVSRERIFLNLHLWLGGKFCCWHKKLSFQRCLSV